MPELRYKYTLSDLIDRLSIIQLKETFIYEHREEYAKEIQDIMHDIDIMLKEEKLVLDATTIRAVIILGQINLHIWINETNCRKGIKEGNSLEKTHGINTIRQYIKNKIQELSGGRKDYKLDCAKAVKEYIPSGYEELVQD